MRRRAAACMLALTIAVTLVQVTSAEESASDAATTELDALIKLGEGTTSPDWTKRLQAYVAKRVTEEVGKQRANNAALEKAKVRSNDKLFECKASLGVLLRKSRSQSGPPSNLRKAQSANRLPTKHARDVTKKLASSFFSNMRNAASITETARGQRVKLHLLQQGVSTQEKIVTELKNMCKAPMRIPTKRLSPNGRKMKKRCRKGGQVDQMTLQTAKTKAEVQNLQKLLLRSRTKKETQLGENLGGGTMGRRKGKRQRVTRRRRILSGVIEGVKNKMRATGAGAALPYLEKAISDLGKLSANMQVDIVKLKAELKRQVAAEKKANRCIVNIGARPQVAAVNVLVSTGDFMNGLDLTLQDSHSDNASGHAMLGDGQQAGTDSTTSAWQKRAQTRRRRICLVAKKCRARARQEGTERGKKLKEMSDLYKAGIHKERNAKRSRQQKDAKTFQQLEAKALTAIQTVPSRGFCVLTAHAKVPNGQTHMYCASSAVRPIPDTHEISRSKTAVYASSCTTLDKGLVLVKHVVNEKLPIRDTQGNKNEICLAYMKVSACGPKKVRMNGQPGKSQHCAAKKLIYSCRVCASQARCTKEQQTAGAMGV